ncbi:MAG: DUF389 domain-containing protein [Acidobacteriota bacterium]|nr:DUF389 domain-containing protein [Acidobacteriota bacterium]
MSSEASESAAHDGAPWRNSLARHLRLRGEQKFEIYVNVATSATMRDATYWAEILFSAGIATLGLTLNSPAVIIGAMLISPLMGPIMSAGLALAAGDFILAMRALVNIVVSSLAAIAFSTILVVLLPFREMTSEIAARTHPNTLDLVVALFSGAVGALAVCKSLRGVATSLPGVAIAVALMPPLCVTGYGVGVFLTIDRVQGTAILAGGGLLFVTNLVAITFSSMLVFLLLHIDSDEVKDKIREWRSKDPESSLFQRRVDRFVPDQVERIGSLPARLALVAAMVAMVFIPLKRSFDALSAEIRQRQRLNHTQRVATATWEKSFAATRAGGARSYIDFLDVSDREGVLAVTVRAFISESILPEERESYTRAIAKTLGRRPETVQVAIVEIPTSTYQVAKAKKEVTPAPVSESAGLRFHRAAQEVLAQIGASRMPAGATLLDQTLAIGSGPPTATIIYLSPAPISDDARSMIASSAREKLDLPTLDTRLVHIPSETGIAFQRGSATIGEATAPSIETLAPALKPRLALRVILHTASNDGLDARRAGAVRDALIAAGAEEARIGTAISENVPNDQVIVRIEKAPAITPAQANAGPK